MRRLLLLIPLVLTVACSSDEDFTPPTTPPGSSIPTIGGTYNSSTMWQLDRTTPTGPEQFICAGGITIANQIGTSFSGSFFLADANCAPGVISGSLVGGTLQAGGAVSFELTLGSESPFMSAVFGCTYVSGDRIVNGTIVDNQLSAQSTTVMACQDGQSTVVMKLSGTR
jgi:hypothetical protein